MTPACLFYCQHSLGMGHLVRSLALAEGLAERFRVVLLNGGPLPEGIRLPPGIEVVNLPPLGLEADGRLLSRSELDVAAAAERRRELILGAYRAVRPALIVIELFPFGRKKFAGELMPLLAAAHAEPGGRPLIACSLRDILVSRADATHDRRAVELANGWFDAVLVHADPALARLEGSLALVEELRIPVHYTGLVAPGTPVVPRAAAERSGEVVISAGGGRVGEALYLAALDAQALLPERSRRPMRVVAGPFCPPSTWELLLTRAADSPDVRVQRSVTDLAGLLAQASGSVSQCGYNTALDLLRARVPAVVVPWGTGLEDEQATRASRLAEAGLVRLLPAEWLNGATLADALQALPGFEPASLTLDLDGVGRSTGLLARQVEIRHTELAGRGA
jgi:predicted glycosyltransferase